MKQLIISPAARSDLQAIHDYIATDNPDAAINLIDRIDASFQLLREQPGIGRVRVELGGYRTIVEGNYVIVYRHSKEDVVEIARVLHGKRNVRRIIRSEEE